MEKVKVVASFEGFSEVLFVNKGIKWKDIKEQIIEKARLNENFEIGEKWYFKILYSSYEELLEDETVIKNDIYVHPELKRKEITVTVECEDKDVTPKNVVMPKGFKLKDIKKTLIASLIIDESLNVDNYFLEDESGKRLTDDTLFKENTTVVVISKDKRAKYTMEVWKENIENDHYTKVSEVKLDGKIGETSNIGLSTYEGFTGLPIEQKKIKFDCSTIVQVKYKRKVISLTFDLSGGTTTTELENGGGWQKDIEREIWS